METFSVSYKGKTPEDIPALQDQAECDENRLAVAVRKRQAAKEVRDRAAQLAAQIDLLMKKKEDLAKRLANIGIDPESVADDSAAECRRAAEKARKNLDAFNGILRDMAAEKGRLEAAEQTIASTKKYLEDLVEKKTLEEKQQAKVDTLKRARDWFVIGPVAA
jgi:DNA repair exonuclease SbcCD ATPase subunit